jgi:hypothetical protein
MADSDPLVPCALCPKYRDEPTLVPKSKGMYSLCSECSSFLRSSDGYEPCCGPRGRGCPRGVRSPVPGQKRCASCQEAFESLRGGA